MDPQPELLSDEPARLPPLREGYDERPARRLRLRHRTAWSVAAAIAVAGASLTLVDAGVRSREAGAVQACERQLQAASDHADYRMGLTTNYVRSVGGGGRTHLADLMAPRARGVLPQVERADRACRAVRIEPWHFGLVARRDAATAYSGALVTLLQIVAAQGGRAFDGTQTLADLRAAAGIDDH